MSDQRSLLVRAVWFVLVGWWLTGVWLSIAWLLNVTIIGIPLGIKMMYRGPLFLSLKRRGALVEGAREHVDTIRGMTGLCCYEPPYDEDGELYLTFLLTDGHSMVGHQGGKPLYCSTPKTRWPERDHCSSYRPDSDSLPPVTALEALFDEHVRQSE
jgi:hypothetical protein